MCRMAEVDGNRTRRTGITHPTRFEGGGAHQALGHLHKRSYRKREAIGLSDLEQPGLVVVAELRLVV